MLKRSILKISTFLMLIVSVALIFSACGKVEFKVNFVVDDEVYATINTSGEEVIKMPTDPTKEGYIFDGWYWDNNDWQKPFTANSLLDAPLSSDMSVYAKWTTPESLQGTEISIKDFESLGNDKYSLKVANVTTSLSLGSYVSVNSKTKWTLSTDIYGNNTIASKVATLSVGDNTYYVLVTADNGSTQLYTLQIRRKPIYNVIFDTVGGTAVQKQEVEEDSLATAPETTKEGYTFVSWNYNFSNPITDNMVVVASWMANSYKISYDVNGGELENKYTEVTFDQNYQLPTPTRRGYSFTGWYNGENLVEDGVYKTEGDTNLKASWKIIDYKITYDLKGGSVATATPSTYTVETDNIILNNPTRLGYEFVGWTGTDVTEPSKGVIIYSNSIGDRTYTANWEFNGYKINYHLNGGTNDENNPIGFTIASANIYLNNPTKEGYIFGGWYKTETFDTDSKITTIPTGSTGDIDIYAKWTPITYSVKFNANGGSGLMNNQLFTYDIEQNLDKNTYTRTGYTFLGWSDSKNDTVVKYADNLAVLNLADSQGDIVEVYAIWKANTNKVTFNKGISEGGTDEVTATYDLAMPEASAPTVPFGYAFNGYFDENNVMYYDSSMVSAKLWDKTADTTLYAKFTAKGATITFDMQGGNGGSTSVNAVYDSAMPNAIAPKKAGYDFAGYFYQANGEGTKYYDSAMTSVHNWDREYDATLYAYYTPSKFTITFNLNGGKCGQEGQASVTATYLSALPDLSLIPTMDGYNFAGYFDAKTGGTKYYDADLSHTANYTNTSNITLYAQWSLISYQVRFDGNGATSGNMANEEFTYNSPKALTKNSYSKTGCYFTGWSTNSDGTGYSYTDGQPVNNLATVSNEIVVLYANWDNTYTVTLSNTETLVEPTYTVSFNLNGVSGSVASQTVTTTSGLTYPSIPTRSGYLFGGWYTTSSCTTLFDFTATVTQDTTVYAKWVSYSGYGTLSVGSNSGSITFPARSSNNYRYYAFVPLVTGSVTIYSSSSSDTYGYLFNSSKSQLTYNDDGGSNNNFSMTYSVTAGQLYYVVACAYSSSSSCSGIIYITGTTKPSTGGKTTGSETVALTQKVTYDSAFTLSTDCERDGYTFAGWYDGVNGTGTQYTDKLGNSVRNWDKAENTTLYAKWVAYTLTTEKKISNAGTISAYTNTNVTAGTSKTIIATTNTGYTWLGWYNGEELLTNDLSYTFTMPESNITYTAKWSVNQYTITFNSNGGSSVDSITQDFGTVVSAPTKPTLEEKSFVGWFDSSLTTEYTFSTIEASNITLYAKWIDYEVTLTCDKRTEISVNDLINAETFNATAVDTDGNSVEVTATVLSGTQTVGSKITVRLVAMGLYDIYATETISNINIYGNPTLTYNTEKDYINMSDTINASLFSATAVDTLENAITVNVSVKEDTYKAGDVVTIVISAIDKTGNETKVEITNVKVYGTPIITRNTDIVDIKATDTIGNDLFGVSAVDSFGVALDVTTIKYSGTFNGGNTITIKSSVTDSKGNSNYITYSVKVYGLPSITNASTTNFKVEDEITLETLGITAKDSFANTLTDVTLELTNGSQIAGATLTYLVTATDHLGNVNTKEITGIKIYGTPTITFDTEKTAIKVTDTINSSLFSATAKDSFDGSLSVDVALNSGTLAGGNVVTFKLSTMDALGNVYEVISQDIKVYSSDDITLTYTTSASNMKKSSKGEEFNATAINSFGETCATSIEVAEGFTLAGGNTINLYIVATDALGNTTKSDLISGIKVYDTPTLNYARDYDYIQSGDSPESLFKVVDSFNKELLFDISLVSGAIDTDETVTYNITAKDRVGNALNENYELTVLKTDESILELYKNGEKVGTQRVYKGGSFTLPYYDGYDVVWYYDGTAITDNRSVSLSAWDKDSNGYIVSTIPKAIVYSITYNLNGGTNNTSNPTTYTIEDSVTLQTPSKVTDVTTTTTYLGNGNYSVEQLITAYTFLGWFTDESFENAITTISGTGAVVLYASWSETTTTTTTTIQAYSRDGYYMYFGTYPQTKVTDTTLSSSLNSLAGTLPTSSNSQKWTSYGYYISGSVTDYMWYIDVEYSGAKYRGVYFTSYRPYYCTISSSSSNGYQYTNGYYTSTVYWFKYEPIKWQILEESNGYATILADLALDSQQYDYDGSYSNNYANSTIRAWLNDTFYNTAFNDLQKALIQTVTVDNSASSTGNSSNSYACSNTNDKVWLLSYTEAFSKYFSSSSARTKKSSDYAKSQGCWASTSSGYEGNCNWWLRSPNGNGCDNARGVLGGGGHFSYGVYRTDLGVVPALKIKLS